MSFETRKYIAKVTKNEDPDHLGRIKVSCPDMVGADDYELPDWVEPLFDWGWFYIPDVDELVEIEVLVGSPRDETYLESSMVSPRMRWLGKRFYGGEDTDQPRPIPDEFKANYKRRGFGTPFGHLFIFDDTKGEQTITVSWTDGNADDPKRTVLLFDKDATIKLSIENEKHILHFKQDEVEIKLNEGASLKLTDKDANATTILGDGAVKAAIADHLEVLYGTLKTWLEAHNHGTGVGPSSTPLNVPAPDWDTAINSNKLKFPDG